MRWGGMEWNENVGGDGINEGVGHVKVGVFLGEGAGVEEGATLHPKIYNVFFLVTIGY